MLLIKRCLLCFCIICIGLACKQKPLLSHAQMANILLDMQLADSYSNFVGTNADKSTKLMRNKDSLNYYYSSVFEHHKINAKKFETAYNWYSHRPADLDSILSIMQKKTEAWNKELDKMK